MDIAVVLVTFNRLKDLKVALRKYEEQTMLPKALIVVNNASTDGTDEYLKDWLDAESNFEKYVVTSERNLGGSGGFYLGMEKAVTLDCPFMFLADDDAFAERDMLEQLANYYESVQDPSAIAALCTSVMDEGQYQLGHRARTCTSKLRVAFPGVNAEEYRQESFEVDILSFVGAVIKKEIVERIGLPMKEYFIYHDDSEYSLRLAQHGKIMCVPSSIMQHKNPNASDITWKEYYGCRNYIHMLKTHLPMRYSAFAALYYYLKRGFLARELTASQRKLYRRAVWDGLVGCLGISNVYFPGMKI